jgi:hypothetical protein
METYKIKQTLIGINQAYVTQISTLAVIIFFAITWKEGQSSAMIIYLTALLILVGYKYVMYIKRPMEIEVANDNRKMKNLFGQVLNLHSRDLTDIEIIKKRELYFTIKENKIRGLNTFKDFDKFLEDAKKKNPNINLWGFSK